MAEEEPSLWEDVEEATELLHEERFHEALLHLRALLTANPQNHYAFHYLGVALFEVGELEPARDAYRACLRLSPRHLGARVSLCHVLRSLGDTREALKEGLHALSQAPGDSDALHAVGLAYVARGDRIAARRYLEAFLAAKPEFEVATEIQGILASLDLPLLS
jgi:Flp pilus assembly protein TadD